MRHQLARRLLSISRGWMAAALAAITTAIVLITGGGAGLLSTPSSNATGQTLQQTSLVGQPVLAFKELSFPAYPLKQSLDLSVESAPQGEQLDSDQGTRFFNGRPIRPARTISMLVTAYSPGVQSCGVHADGITASGYSVWTNGMKMVAADTKLLPFGSLVSVPGYDDGNVVPVLDRGGKIKGNRLDVLYSTHAIAKQWGAQRLEVTVWEYADGKGNDFKQQHQHRR